MKPTASQRSPKGRSAASGLHAAPKPRPRPRPAQVEWLRLQHFDVACLMLIAEQMLEGLAAAAAASTDGSTRSRASTFNLRARPRAESGAGPR